MADNNNGTEGEQKKPGANQAMPDLKKYVEKRILVRLEGGRKVSGTLLGYDHYMNVVLSNATEECYDGTSKPMGDGSAPAVIRGNTVVSFEPMQ